MGRLIDIIFVTLLVFVGMLVADYASEEGFADDWLGTTINWHLGAEYNNIAQAIYAGNGFSDPFESGSGPTAWMPPVLPFILAGLYWLTDFQPDAVVEIVLGLKAAVLIFTGTIVLAEARRLGVVWFGYLLLPIALAVNFFDLFQITHDLWILLLVVDLIWIGANRFWIPTSPIRSIAWGLLGGFTALCSPTIGAAWALLTLFGCSSWLSASFGSDAPTSNSPQVRDKLVYRRIAGVLIAAITSMAVVTPWTVRNRLTFGKWIPIKSNSGFELWQSQCLDDDGVLDRDLTSDHPYASDGAERQRYLQLGESVYLTEKARAGWSCVVANPTGYFQRCGHRFMAAFLWYYPYSESAKARVWPLRIKRGVFPFVLLSFFAVCIVWRLITREFVTASILYFAIMIPYVMISYGDRYAAPTIPLKCIILLQGVACIATNLGKTNCVKN